MLIHSITDSLRESVPLSLRRQRDRTLLQAEGAVDAAREARASRGTQAIARKLRVQVRPLGLGRIVVSEIEAPNVLVDLV